MRTVSVLWQNISAKSINNCFKHAGFAYNNEQCHSETETLQEPEGWNEIISKLNVECSYEDYVVADDNITVTEELNDADLVELRNSRVYNEECSDDDDAKEDAVPIAPSKSSELQAHL